MSERKTSVINGTEYEEMGPYCTLCKSHMGEYYYSEGKQKGDPGNKPRMFLNPHNYESFSDNICPGCGTEYEYDEGNTIVLSDEDKMALLALRQKG